MQKSATKNHKKSLLGKKCLKPAISKVTQNGTHFWSHFLLMFKLIFCLMLDHCLEPFRIPFWNPWWMKTAQREKQMTQNNHQRHQKPKKQHSQKTSKNNVFFNVFDNKGLSRKPQEAEEGSQKAPKKSKIPKNRNPKLSPKIIKYWNQFFGAHSETQAQQK